MAKLSKEQKAYNDGMAFAYRIAKADGIEELEHEIKWRGLVDLPMNYRARDVEKVVHQVAEQWCDIQRRQMGCASAITLIDVMKIPARTVRKYIEEFCARMILFRHDKEAFRQAEERMNKEIAISEALKGFDIDEMEAEVLNDGK